MTLIMLLSTLAGCLDTETDVEEELDELGIESLPKQSIGLSLPTIDGTIVTFGPGANEWADSYALPSADVGFSGAHGGKVDESGISLRMKAVGDDVAVALEVPLISGTNASVASVSSKFYYSDSTTILSSSRSASVGEAESPWSVEMITPCVVIDCIEDEFSMIQKSDFEAVPLFTLEEEEESTVEYDGFYDLLPSLYFDLEHLLAAKQSTSLLTLETLRYDALEYSRTLSGLEITVTFEDGSSIDFDLNDLYFGYANPSSKETDVGITGVELIQVVQTEDMDMPLVKQMPTLARVYVTSDIDMFDVEVKFQLCILILCTSPMTRDLEAPSSIDREDFTKSANFIIPQEWLEFDAVSVVASVNIPYVSEFSDTDSSNDMWAETFQLTTTSEVTSAYVRLSQNTDSDSALEQLDSARTKKLMGLNMDLMPLNDYTLQEFQLSWSDGETYDASDCDDETCITVWAAAVEDYRTQLISAWITSECVAIAGGLLAAWGECPLPPIPFQFGAIYPVATSSGGFTGGIANPVWADGDSFAYTAAPQFHAQVTGESATTIPIHEIQHNIGPAQGWCDWFIDDNGNGVSDFPDECTVFGGYGPGEWGEHLSTTGVKATDDCGAGGQDTIRTSIYGSTGKPFDIKDLGWNQNNVDPETNQDALVPSSYPDLMTYCIAVTSSEIATSPSFLAGDYEVPYLTDDYRAWMSTYRWLRNHDYFSNHATWDPSGGTYARSASSIDSNIIRTVNLDLSFNNKSGYAVEDFNSEITTGIMSDKYNTGEVDERGYMSILALDEDGNVLATRAIYPQIGNAEIEMHGGDVNSPHITTWGVSSHRVRFVDTGNIHSVVLIDSDERAIDYLESTVDVRGAGAIYDVSLNSRSYERGDVMKVEWDAARAGFLYSVEYSTGDGIWYPLSGWIDGNSGEFPVAELPASDEALIRVQMNNGFDSAFMYSTPFNVENQAPILDVDIQTGSLMFNSALPQPNLIPFEGNFSEKEAQEIMSAAMRMPNIAISQHETITITPNVQDMDWEVVNDQGCVISLERDGRIVWSTDSFIKLGDIKGEIIRSTYTIDNVFANSKNDPCTSEGGKFSSVSFPNPEFPSHMMTPGVYSLKITYADASGASAEPVVINFNVFEDRVYSDTDLNDFRDELEIVHPEFVEGDADRLCKLWSETDWAREAEKTEGIEPEDLRVIAETDMASVCALGMGQKSAATGDSSETVDK